MQFQNGCNKEAIELRVVQFWSEIILVNSNRTRGARSFDFEITRMISDQIAQHSVYHYEVCINNDLVIHRQAQTSDIISRRFSDFMTPLSRVQMFQSSQEMHEQIRLSCQRDALHQTINTEFEHAKVLKYLFGHLRYVNQL